MSIEQEITRINNNISDAFSAVEEQGGTVEDGANSDDLAQSILNIPAGSVEIAQETGDSETAVMSQKVVTKELNNLSQEMDGKQPKGNYLTEVPAEYVTETELESKGYAKQSDVNNLSQEIVDLGNEKVDYADLETEVADQLDGVKVDIVREVMAQINSEANSIFGKVNEDGTITLTTDLAEGEYTLMYENEDGTLTEIGSVTIGGLEVFTITRTLSGCTSNKSETAVEGGSAWTETLSANSGHNFSSVIVTMGGVDVTNSVYSGGVINITEVTGDIVITATAVKPNYTNLADPTSSDWSTNTRLNSSGATKASSGALTTNYIACKTGDVLRIKGLDMKNGLPDGTNNPEVCVYNSSKTNTLTLYPRSTHANAFVEANGIVTYTFAVDNNGNQLPVECAFIRVCGTPKTGEEVIITLNQEIK